MIAPGGTTLFAYNASGMVARIRWQDATSTYFFYDGQIRRYAMVEAGVPVYFLWDSLNILEELNPDFSSKQVHTHRLPATSGVGQVVESYRPSEGASLQRIYPLMDVRGSIVVWQQSDGATSLAVQEYDAFGQAIPNSGVGAWPSRFRYEGQAWMALRSANGEQILYASPTRLYNPVDGRFVERELLLKRRVLNPYTFAANSPVNMVDVLGLQEEKVTPLPGSRKAGPGTGDWADLEPHVKHARAMVDATLDAIKAAKADPCATKPETQYLKEKMREYFGCDDATTLANIEKAFKQVKQQLDNDMHFRLYRIAGVGESGQRAETKGGVVHVWDNFPFKGGAEL